MGMSCERAEAESTPGERFGEETFHGVALLG